MLMISQIGLYEFREWFNGYKERKVQKAQIKAELLPIAWHPDRYNIDWCLLMKMKSMIFILIGGHHKFM